jgi:hypothetical protein
MTMDTQACSGQRLLKEQQPTSQLI